MDLTPYPHRIPVSDPMHLPAPLHPMHPADAKYDCAAVEAEADARVLTSAAALTDLNAQDRELQVDPLKPKSKPPRTERLKL